MGEGERRAFLKHLKEEGYENAPEDDEELYASTREFYEANTERYVHPLLLDPAACWDTYRAVLEAGEESCAS